MAMRRREGKANRLAERAGRSGTVLFEAVEPRVLLSFNPTAQEQYMLELLNHLRMDPQADLDLMTSSLGAQARSSDPDIDSALQFFHVSGTALAQQWAALVAVPPLAWSERLYNSAAGHTQVMIDSDSQTHQAPGEPDLGQRATNAGYNYSTMGENVYAFAEGVLHGHAGFAIDWGNDANGIQDPPGHRDNMMSASFREVGIRILSESNDSTQVGPLVITQDFGNRFSLGNPFLLGAVFNDSDGNGLYGVGEGLGNVTVTVVGAAGTFMATSMDAGGYQLQVPSGVYDVTFSGGGFGDAVTYRNITVSGQNTKVDGVRGAEPPQPDIEVVGNGVAILSGDRLADVTDGTFFGSVNLAGTLARTFTIRNVGGAPLQLTGTPRVTVSGAGIGLFTIASNAGAGLLQPGEETSFTVLFDPVNTRYRNANILIASDDPDEPLYTFVVRGRGQNAPEIDISGGRFAEPIADGDTTPAVSDWTGFNTVNVANRARARTYTIANNGNRTLVLTSIDGSFVQITGSDAQDFRVIEQPTGVLLPGQSTTFRVRFNPSAGGPRQATVSLMSNDPDEGTFDFAVRGQGRLAPIVRIWGNGERLLSTDAPSAEAGTDFGEMAAASGVVVRTFTISNIGSSDLFLRSARRQRVTIAGDADGGYRVRRQPSVSVIGAGESVTFRVRFDPTGLGAATATIVIDTVNAGVYTFSIAGMGV